MDGIIVDTSSILFALSNKVDIFKRVEEQSSMKPIISRGIERELRKIAASMRGQGKYASVALQLIGKYKVEIVENNDYPDEWIFSQAHSMAVCTNDMKLKRALKKEGASVYTISKDGALR